MAGADKRPDQHEKKQASGLISGIAIIVFGVIVCASFAFDNVIPLYVYCIFVAIIVPPELVKRVLRALLGGKDEE